MPIRVLVPVTHAELGGSQQFLLKLIDAMPESIAWSAWLFESGLLAEELRVRDVSVQVLPAPSIAQPWRLASLWRALRRDAPDVVYLHASRLIALLARQAGIPCVERINMTRRPEAGGWCNRYPWIDRIMTRWNTKVVAVSEAIRQQLLERGVESGRIVLIRNFVDVERFYRPDLRASTRAALGIPETARLVLNIGRCVPQKGQADFLKVAAKCLPCDEDLYFVMVGDGPLKPALEQQAVALGLPATGRFQILPFRRDIEAIYSAGDLLLHTAHWDPLANVLLEAMAARLEVIATDVDGTREALADYGAGTLMAAGDVDAMAKAILDAVVPATATLPVCWNKECVVESYRRLFELLANRGAHEQQ